MQSVSVNHTWEPILYRMNRVERQGLEDLLRFYSPHGVIRKVVTFLGAGGTMPCYVGHGWFYDYDHVLRNATGLTGLETRVKKTIYGGGKGDSLFGMFASTLGELVERVFGCLAYLEHSDRCAYGSYSELSTRGHRCLGPDELHLFAREQYEDSDMVFDPYTRDTVLAWIKGKRLFSGEAVWVPAQLVLLYYRRRPNETPIGFSTTGGLACHVSELEALYHGITELFERDAMNVSWYSGIRPKVIEIDRDGRVVALRRLLQTASGLPGNLKFYLHDLDTPELPKVTVIEINDWLQRYAYYSGGGVGLDIDRTMLSAINEYGQAERNMRLALVAPDWQFSKTLEGLFDVDPDAPVRDLDIFFKIVPYYGYTQNIRKMRWLHRIRRLHSTVLFADRKR